MTARVGVRRRAVVHLETREVLAFKAVRAEKNALTCMNTVLRTTGDLGKTDRAICHSTPSYLTRARWSSLPGGVFASSLPARNALKQPTQPLYA